LKQEKITMPIRVLPEDVAIKIAAGEVVERPMSVVKELVENSIDAGATEIKIRIEQGGRRLIEVSDNGQGIPNEELPLSIERYATSKIQVAEDLFHLHSLGFRGEALSSIAAVSRFTLQSHAVGEIEGNEIIVIGGKNGTNKAVGMPNGSLVRVEDLFFNTPARLKFIKQELTEKRQIITLIQRYAFAYSNIRFHLIIDNKKVLQTAGDQNSRQVLSAMLDLEEARQMLEVNFNDGEHIIKGFTSPVGLSRSNRKEISIFINGRWVTEASLSAAVIQGYNTFLMVGRYPLSYLLIVMPPEDVDVNVHPAKAEIRLKNPGFIFSLVQRSIRRALITSSPTPLNFPKVWPENGEGDKPIDFAWVMSHDAEINNAKVQNQQNHGDGNLSELKPIPLSDHIPLLRLVGQIGAAYLVAEGPDGLYLIDQHAAHERVLYEKFAKLKLDDRPRQQMLDPLSIQFPFSTFQLLFPQIELLNRMGFEIDEFGENTIRVKSVPSLFSNVDPLSLIKTCVEDFEEDENPLGNELEKKIIARICKRSAIKSGQILSREEQQQLVSDLERCEIPRSCPHGRPTMIHLSVDLLERQFGRKGSR
jgi:DNA mismatch repair protein MutL